MQRRFRRFQGRKYHCLQRWSRAGWTAQGPRLGYALVDVWRSAELDRGGRNLEDAMFRL